ncbi:hypothetical protein ACFLW1_02540 [Chloroflexota bacterium]
MADLFNLDGKVAVISGGGVVIYSNVGCSSGSVTGKLAGLNYLVKEASTKQHF